MVTEAEEFSEAVKLIRATKFENRPGEARPDGYYGALLGEQGPEQQQALRTRLRFMRDLFEFGGVDPVGMHVLEAGSGFGIGLVAAACLGASKVTGVELVDWQAEWSRACIERLEMGDRISTLTGSATNLPVADGSVDILLSVEAISHYLDYSPFLAEAARVLRPGGVLIVSDGNNGLNPRIRKYTERLWVEHETDPRTYVHDTRRGEYNPWLLVEHRRKIVADRYRAREGHEIDSGMAWKLALNTAGMVRAEIESATDHWIETGLEPSQPYVPGTLTVHPDQEMVMERLFNPWKLGEEIESYGFSCKVRGHWAGASGKPLYRLADKVLSALSPLTMPTARGFRIAALRKP